MMYSSPKSQNTQFAELLKSRKRKGEELTPESRIMLQQSVFRLISHHQNKEQVFKETLQSGVSKTKKTETTQENLMSCEQAQCISVLQSEDEQDGLSSVLSIINLIHEKVNVTPGQLLSPKQQTDVFSVVRLLKQTILCNAVSEEDIINLLNKQKFSIEVWWMLNKQDIYSFNKYLELCTISDVSQDLSDKLYKLIPGSPETLNSRTEILKDYMENLVKLTFSDRKSEQRSTIRKTSMKILDGITKAVLCNLMEYNEGTVLHTKPPKDVFKHVGYKKFATHTLSFTMSYAPNIIVSQALKNQSQWTSAKANPVRIQLYKQMLLLFEAKDVLDILHRILERQEVNWENVLSFLATYLVCFKDAPNLVEGHVRRLLSDGLEQCDMENTIVAFLLVRQSCLEGLHVFPSYQSWFHRTFGESGKSVAETKKAFTFLMKFLTDIVPFELAVYLKAHVVMLPWTPPKCRHLVADYTLLAKTRLADLKESIGPVGGIYDEADQQTTTTNKVDQAVQDVNRAISSFHITGKVPATVMEASIFRKPYFIGKFLPALLKPRPLPDIPDTKMKFIKNLRKAEKISTALYIKYETSCQDEAKKLLEGVFNMSDSDDEMDGMMLEPLDQINHYLKQLHDCVTKVNNKVSVAEVLSVISEKMEVILNIDKPTNQSESRLPSLIVDINLTYPDLNIKHVELVDILLNFICKMVCIDLQSTKPSSEWLSGLVSVFSQHHQLQKALYTRLLILLTYKNPVLQNHHIIGLSALISVMSSSQSIFSYVTVNGCCKCVSKPDNILNTLVHRMEGYVVPTVLFRFLTEYLRFSFRNYNAELYICDSERKPNIINSHILKQYILLSWRYKKQCIGQIKTKDVQITDEIDIVSHILTSQTFQHLTANLQISFQEWLDLEISLCSIDSLSDIDRYTYQSQAVYEYYLVKNGVTEICSVLLQKSLDLQYCNTDTSHISCISCLRGDNSKLVLELTNLLQGLLYILPSSTEESKPWLISEYTDQQLNQTDASISLIKCTKTMCFFRYMMKFPAHLLFVNQIIDIKPSMISSSIDFLKNKIKPYINDGCYLPLPLTAYIIQGLVSVCPFLEDTSMLEKIMADSIIIISVTIHWPHINNLWLKLGIPTVSISTSLPIVLKILDSNGVVPADNNLVVTATFFRLLKYRNFSDVDDILFPFIQDEQENKIIFNLVEMLVAYSSANIFQNGDSYINCQEVLKTILVEQPSVLEFILDSNSPNSIRQTVASHEAEEYLHLTLLRCVSTLPDNSLKSFLQVKINISLLILCFQKVTQQLEGSSTSEKQTIEEVLELSEFIKKCLTIVPKCYFTGIDQDVMKSCGVDVYNMFITILSS